jgi:hypothetical protein
MDTKAKANTWAKDIWACLDSRQRGELGDELVLGTFDWRDWSYDPPPVGGISALAKLQANWEV